MRPWEALLVPVSQAAPCWHMADNSIELLLSLPLGLIQLNYWQDYRDTQINSINNALCHSLPPKEDNNKLWFGKEECVTCERRGNVLERHKHCFTEYLQQWISTGGTRLRIGSQVCDEGVNAKQCSYENVYKHTFWYRKIKKGGENVSHVVCCQKYI